MRPGYISLTVVVATLFLNFTGKDEIKPCYIQFKSATGLTAATPDRLPEQSRIARLVKTARGAEEISRLDGYRVLYNNSKNVAFVNLKVELSNAEAYETDTIKLIENLQYINSQSATEMETKDLIRLEFNGFKIFGLSRSTIERGSNLGTFVMFPGDDVIVYFYFNNINPELRNFETLEEYKEKRNRFMEEYTKHLKACSSK